MHATSVSLIFFLILIAVLLGLGYPTIRGLWLRFRICRWIKMLAAARTARHRKRFTEADRFLRQALDVCDQLPRHWKVKAVTCSELASLYSVQGNYREAERFRRDELSLREKFDGSPAPETVVATSSLATLLDDAGKSTEAEPLHRQAVEILQQLPGFANEASNSMNNYARCLHKLGRLDESASLYQ
jgi:tetratricopeptide (TPR) repeat protein